MSLYFILGFIYFFVFDNFPKHFYKERYKYALVKSNYLLLKGRYCYIFYSSLSLPKDITKIKAMNALFLNRNGYINTLYSKDGVSVRIDGKVFKGKMRRVNCFDKLKPVIHSTYQFIYYEPNFFEEILDFLFKPLYFIFGFLLFIFGLLQYAYE